MGRIPPKLPDKHERKKKRRVRAGLVIVSVFLAVGFIVYLFLSRSGFWLVQDDSFEHVPWVFVLDGQTADLERTRFAGDLLLSGRADSVLIYGRRIFWDKNNADFYAEDLMRSGNIDASRIFLFRHDDPSTIEEAYSSIPWMKERGIDSVLLVTSAAASKRVKQIFETLGGDSITFLTTDIHHYLYNPGNWAFERESRKIWLREWAALLYSKWDLLWAKPAVAVPGRLYPAVPLESAGEVPPAPQVNLDRVLPAEFRTPEPDSSDSAASLEF